MDPSLIFLAQCYGAVPNVNCEPTPMNETIRNLIISPTVLPALKKLSVPAQNANALGLGIDTQFGVPVFSAY